MELFVRWTHGMLHSCHPIVAPTGLDGADPGVAGGWGCAGRAAAGSVEVVGPELWRVVAVHVLVPRGCARPGRPAACRWPAAAGWRRSYAAAARCRSLPILIGGAVAMIAAGLAVVAVEYVKSAHPQSREWADFAYSGQRLRGTTRACLDHRGTDRRHWVVDGVLYWRLRCHDRVCRHPSRCGVSCRRLQRVLLRSNEGHLSPRRRPHRPVSTRPTCRP